jgi:hypothetical protein
VVLALRKFGAFEPLLLKTPGVMERRVKCKEIMLQQFTWQQFLIAALVFTLIWYAGVILLFYRKELNAFLRGKRKNEQVKEPLPHRWEQDTTQLQGDESTEDDLMGESRMPEGVGRMSMSDFGFSDEGKEQQIGLVPDVLEEIKEVFSILAREDGSKKDFFGLIKLVKEKYPKITANPNIGYINEFIADHAPFRLSVEELEDMWE